MLFRPLIFASTLILTACQQDQSNHPSPSHSEKTYRVLVQEVEQRSLPTIYRAPGTIVAKDQLQLASRITGYIDQIAVDEGDVVQPGAVLVRIDGTQVEAAIRGAKAAITSAKAELQDAEEDLKRYRSLSKTQALAKDQLRDAEVRRTKAKAAVVQAEAELEAKHQDRRHVQLASPVRAQVRERLHDRGDLASAGEPILRLDVLGATELEVFLSSSQISHIAKGQKIEVFVQSDAHPIAGEVTRIVHSADSVTRRSKVRIALPNNDGLSPGQFARAHIPLGHQTASVVPVSAIVERAGIEGVFVVEGDGTLRFRSIRTGKIREDHREVLAGVEVGQSVALNPPAPLRDGDRAQKASADEN